MLKNAYDEGTTAALTRFKLALAPSLLQKVVGTAVRNPNLALAGAGALGGALLGDDNNRAQSALIGAGLGYGAGRLGAGNAVRRGIVGKPEWLGSNVANFAQQATKMRAGF